MYRKLVKSLIELIKSCEGKDFENLDRVVVFFIEILNEQVDELGSELAEWMILKEEPDMFADYEAGIWELYDQLPHDELQSK